MSMPNLNPSYGAPFTAKSGQSNPDDILREIMEDMPNASEKKTWSAFRAEILKDQDLIEACLRWYHVNARHRLEKLMEKTADLKRSKKRDKKTVAVEKVKTRKRAKVKLEVVKKAFILDHVMPNGELLRDCTFRYVGKVGGAFAVIARMGKPSQVVGDVLSNRQADAAMRGA